MLIFLTCYLTTSPSFNYFSRQTIISLRRKRSETLTHWKREISFLSCWLMHSSCLFCSCRASSSPSRLPPARPQEVWCGRSCSPEPRTDVGGDSGGAGQRAAGFGSSPPGRLCSATEVKLSSCFKALTDMYCLVARRLSPVVPSALSCWLPRLSLYWNSPDTTIDVFLCLLAGSTSSMQWKHGRGILKEL